MTVGLTHVLQALERNSTLPKLEYAVFVLIATARLIQMELSNIPSLQSLDLAKSLGYAILDPVPPLVLKCPVD